MKKIRISKNSTVLLFVLFCHARSLCLISSKKLIFNNVRCFKINITNDAGTKNGTEIINFLPPKTRKTVILMPFSAFASHLQGVKVIIELTVSSSSTAQKTILSAHQV